MEPFKTVVELIRHVQKDTSNPKALNFQVHGQWISMSTEQFVDEIKYVALGLRALGLQRGDTVGILAFPSPFWTITDLAIIIAGGVSVPLFANLSDDNFEFEVNSTQTKILFVSGLEQLSTFSRHKSKFHTIISMNYGELEPVGITYQELMELGKKLEAKQPNLYEELENAVHPDDLATIIHTSGSTGVPKGVMLTNLALVALLHENLLHWNQSDRYLSILPLAHIFGRRLNLLLIACGMSIYYSNDIKNLGHVCRQIHPTLIVVVPRLLEKVYAKMLATVQHAGYMKRTFGRWAFELANMEEDSVLKHMLHPIVDKIVYSALRDSLGGSLKYVLTGSAALDPHLCHFFLEIGVPIYEGWGLTEATPISVNTPEDYKIGTVGKPIPGVEVKVSPEGELLVRGSLIMHGYYKDKESTAESLRDGWLHTGDKGKIDEDGFITIFGRMKELFKTSTGEFIVPVPIEQALCKAPLIDMAVVIGMGKKFASCLLFPDNDVLHSLKAAHNALDMTDEDFLETEFVKREMNNLLENINKHVNHWEQLRAYRFVLHPLTPETGELTPSLKVRREVVADKFKKLIDDMYREEKI